MENQKEVRLNKTFDLKAAELSENTIRGMASTYGNPDRVGDVIFPGFFKSVLRQFKENGFVAVGHAWDGLPVAMPTVATEKYGGLYCEAVFHSTSAAQEARTVCKERIDNELSVGISVGFMPDYSDENSVKYFNSGKELATFIKENGYNESDFKMAEISKIKGWCRALIHCKELYEWSIVTVPCNPKAVAIGVKSMNQDELPTTIREYEDFLRDVGFSRKQAVALASKGFNALRDAVIDEPIDTSVADVVATEDITARLKLLDLRLKTISIDLKGAI